MSTETKLWNSAVLLRDKEDVIAYLELSLEEFSEDGDVGALIHALGIVAKSRYMSELNPTQRFAMSRLGRRLIEAAKEALAYVDGTADKTKYRVYHPESADEDALFLRAFRAEYGGNKGKGQIFDTPEELKAYLDTLPTGGLYAEVTYRFPLEITPDDNGTLLVTCPVLPEVTTFGVDHDDALARGREAVDEAISARIAANPKRSKPKRGAP